MLFNQETMKTTDCDAPSKSQTFPAICSMIVPGLGQFIQGRNAAGTVWGAGMPLLFLMCFVLLAAGAVFWGLGIFFGCWAVCVLDAAGYDPAEAD